MAKKSTVERKRKSLAGKKLEAGATAAVEKTAAGTEGADGAPVKRSTRKTLVKEAYQQVGRKLADAKDPTKAIDDLVKLAKIEKDMGGEEEKDVEVRARWVHSEKDESSKDQ